MPDWVAPEIERFHAKEDLKNKRNQLEDGE